MNSRTIWALLAITLFGCADDPRLAWPDYSKSRLMVVTGYFSHATGVHAETQECFPGEVIDCGLPPVGTAGFKIEDVLYGVAPPTNLVVRVNLYKIDDPFPMGPKNRVLLFLTSDGRIHDFERAYRLAQTTDRHWAVPVLANDSLLHFPCIDDPAVNAVEYAMPKPVMRLNELSTKERKRAVDERLLEVNGDTGLYRNGILLRDLRAAYATSDLGPDCEW